MCGLIGFSGSKNYDPLRIGFIMLSNIVRGENATGMYFDKKVTKDTEKVNNFLSVNENKITPSKLFLGHTRKKSIGENIASNAHPFKVGNIVGVHNGTLSEYKNALENIGVAGNKFGTDSESLFALINHYKEDLSKISNDVTGAVAIMWVNEDTGILNLYRNFDRPLFYCETPEGLYMSSMEESFIPLNIESTDITRVPINTHIKIKDGKIISETTGIHICSGVKKTYGYDLENDRNFNKDSYVVAVNNDTTKGIIKDKLYFVIRNNVTDWLMDVINDNGVVVEVYKSYFKRSKPLINNSKAVICKKGTKGFFKLNEIVHVVGILQKNERKFFAVEKEEYDNKTYDVPAIMVRPLSDQEYEAYNQSIILEYLKKKANKVKEAMKFIKKNVPSDELYESLSGIITSFETTYEKVMIDSQEFMEDFMKPFEDVIAELVELRDSLVKNENGKEVN